jgi:hypothetical protein
VINTEIYNQMLMKNKNKEGMIFGHSDYNEHWRKLPDPDEQNVKQLSDDKKK